MLADLKGLPPFPFGSDYDWTYLDLDHCVGNNGGFLIPYPG